MAEDPPPPPSPPPLPEPLAAISSVVSDDTPVAWSSVGGAMSQSPDEGIPPEWQHQHPWPHPAMAMAHYYQAQMRDHAAAYASAAAGAAWAAAQIATVNNTSVAASLPPVLAHPVLPHTPQFWHPTIITTPNPAMMYNVSLSSPPMYHHSQQQQPCPHHHGEGSPRPGKRQQRMTGGAASWEPPGYNQQYHQQRQHPYHHQHHLWGQEEGGSEKRGRRRLRSALDNATNSSDNNTNTNNGSQSRRGGSKRPTQQKSAPTSSGDEQSCFHSKKHRPPRARGGGGGDDTTLIGKTGVSALHEWCDKRRIHPQFILLDKEEGGDCTSNSNTNWSSTDFDISVHLNGEELGRGRGGTKASAKQDAARHALQALLPGVVFDSNGILVQLPPSSTGSLLEELAPNLASRLAIIGHHHQRQHDFSQPQQPHHGFEDSNKRPKPSPTARRWDVYPGTSTTSEDDNHHHNENDYYASRGASVCSALLHAMWQIDERIIEPPSYTYEICANPATTANATSAQLKRKGTSGGSATVVVVHRSSFACTARLVLQQPQQQPTASVVKTPNTHVGGAEAVDSTKDDSEEDTLKPPGAQQGHHQAIDDGEFVDSEHAKEGNNRENMAKESEDQRRLQILAATGTGATKREARHVASAKLLAMLFPECDGMVEVKAAAEAAREKYAASKARKQQSKRAATLTTDVSRVEKKEFDYGDLRVDNDSRKRSISFAQPEASDPPLPPCLDRQLREILDKDEHDDFKDIARNDAVSTDIIGDEVSVESLSLSDKVESKRDKILIKDCMNKHTDTTRSLSRQKQLESSVDSALQILNDLDDEGRSLPEELNVDDVGRTVLRRAECEDIIWIQKLLSKRDERVSAATTMDSTHGIQIDLPGPLSLLVASARAPLASGATTASSTADGNSTRPSRLWGSVTITLLLCRAIDPFDEPPLGCAVLTLGFTMKDGQVLRLADIVREPHLPKERFIECLQRFASHMKCVLDTSTPLVGGSHDRISATAEQLRSILEAYTRGSIRETVALLEASDHPPLENMSSAGILDMKTIGASLQSVQEEDTDVEETDVTGELRLPKGRDKPSKRSRVV